MFASNESLRGISLSTNISGNDHCRMVCSIRRFQCQTCVFRATRVCNGMP